MGAVIDQHVLAGRASVSLIYDRIGRAAELKLTMSMSAAAGR